MAIVNKCVQQAPGSTSWVTLYTTPSSTKTLVSSMFVCNRSGTPTTFRIAVRVGGSALDNKQYLYYDVALGANDTFQIRGGLTLAVGDLIDVYASSANVSFNAFVQETPA